MTQVLLSIAGTFVAVLFVAVIIKQRKQEKDLEELKKAVFRHEVILEQDQDPMKNWPDKDLA